MNVQMIEKNGKPEYVVLPYDEYKRLLVLAEEAADIHAFDTAVTSEEETLPHEMVKRLVEGESPIHIWRQHRGLTQTQLAERAGVAQSYIAMLEKGDRQGTVEVLQKVAAALNVDVDDLVG